MHLKHRRSAVLATLSVFALLAAACGDDDDGGSSAGTDAVAVTDAPSGTDAPETTTAETDAPADTEAPDETDATNDTTATDDTTADDAGSPSVKDRELPPGERHVEDDEGEPVKGGDLVFGIEADSANPWAPYRTSCATACYVMITSVSDPLFTATDDGAIAPMLVESYEPNADSTEWTLKIRDGIKFHDGTPLDGAAVEFNMESCQYSSLTGAAYLWIEDISSSGQTVTIKTNGAVRRDAPPVHRAAVRVHVLADVAEDAGGHPPAQGHAADLRRHARGDAGDGDPSKPVGLGAYKFDIYTPGNGNSFKLSRNDDYWRGPNGITGEQLPYLDSVEGVVAVDIDSRSNGAAVGAVRHHPHVERRHDQAVRGRRRSSRRSPRASSATPATSC